MDSISLQQLQAERERLARAREDLKLNLVAHDGAIQALDQLILLAKNQKDSPAPTAESGEGGQRDAPAEEQPGASQKA